MKCLERYISSGIIWATLFILLVLVSIDSFFALTDEMGALGKGAYDFWAAVRYVGLTIPKRIYEFFPIAGLIGGLIALGNLSMRSELVVMRSAGLSVRQIAVLVMKIALLLMILVTFLGEYIAPVTEQWAERGRAEARSGEQAIKTKFGSWVRHGRSFFRIEKVSSNSELRDVTRYDFDESHRLILVTRADHMQFANGQWQLSSVKYTDFRAPKVKTELLNTLTWGGIFGPDVLELLTVRPENLSLAGLWGYIQYLESNHLATTAYWLEFWSKLMQPISMAVMMLLAIPLVIISPRHTPLSLRLLMGVGIGLVFQLFTQLVKSASLVYGVPPFVAVWMPVVLFSLAGAYLVKKTR